MKLEYLFSDTKDKNTLKTYKPEGIKKKTFSTSKDTVFCVQFSADGENEVVAKKLSSVDDYIKTHFSTTVLEDGISLYYCNRLYPLIATFENKLRKLLYLASAVTSKQDLTNNIVNLESKDFGKVFTMLFISDSFISTTKSKINNCNKEEFSKADVLALIESIEEPTIWDNLLSKNIVPTLRTRFNDVRGFRNDVMHLHYINYEKYCNIRELFNTINLELDAALHNMDLNEIVEQVNPAFSETLQSALTLQDTLRQISSILNPKIEEIEQLTKLSDATVAAAQDYLSAIKTSPLNNLIKMQMAAQTSSLSNIGAAAAALTQVGALSSIESGKTPALEKQKKQD